MDFLNRIQEKQVTVTQVKEELMRIKTETGAPIIISHIFPDLTMAFNEGTGEIHAHPENLAKEANKLPLEVPWREWLRMIVNHELAHKKQLDFLLKRGITESERRSLHHHWLVEMQADYVAPHEPHYEKVWQRWARDRFLDKSRDYWVDRWELRPVEMVAYARVLSEEDIRGKKLDEPYQEVLLGLKELSNLVRTNEDILRYASRAEELEDKIF